jgi:hypothetical protein
MTRGVIGAAALALSKFEAMRLELSDLVGFHVCVHYLSHIVLVESGCSSAEEIRHVFEVVLLHMVDKSRGHMGMVRARS